jgi:hypothetical protein
MIIVMCLLCYLALGALMFSILLHLEFINALYLTVVSIETIGKKRTSYTIYSSPDVFDRLW